MFKYSMERKSAFAAAGAAQPTRHAITEDDHFSWRDRLESLPRLLPFVVLIAVIMIALYGGWATPSEVAGIGAAGAVIMVVTVYQCWKKEDINAILSGTVRESTMIMMIIATSALFTFVMSYLGVTQQTATWLVGLGLSKWAFFFGVNLFIVVLGFFLPPVAIILMVTPIILPSLKAMGIDLVWFGIIMTILMEMGLIHPPVGLNLFVISGIAPDIKLKKHHLGHHAVHRPDGAGHLHPVPGSGHRRVAAQPFLQGQLTRTSRHRGRFCRHRPAALWHTSARSITLDPSTLQPYELFIGLRYTRAKRRNHFISFISLISMLGMALGVMALIVVLSVMNGFQKEIRARMLGATPHLRGGRATAAG